jgi:hypothetical protein
MVGDETGLPLVEGRHMIAAVGNGFLAMVF